MWKTNRKRPDSHTISSFGKGTECKFLWPEILDNNWQHCSGSTWRTSAGLG